MSKLYQKRLISVHDLYCLPYHYSYMEGHSSRHWLDSLVRIQSSKPADECARTFITLKKYSLTEVGIEGQTKPTGVAVHYFHSYACTHGLFHL